MRPVGQAVADPPLPRPYVRYHQHHALEPYPGPPEVLPNGKSL
jgi:hypothetical protein